jgi:ribosomal protein L11
MVASDKALQSLYKDLTCMLLFGGTVDPAPTARPELGAVGLHLKSVLH